MTPGVALVGCGHWGMNLARNLAALGALRVVHDADAAAVDRVRARHREARAAADLRAVLDAPDVDACVIATPAASHHALARQVLTAGKDVLVEKPLALTVAEGEELTELAARHGRILMVGHLLEYHPAIDALRALAGRGDLGELQYVAARAARVLRCRCRRRRPHACLVPTLVANSRKQNDLG